MQKLVFTNGGGQTIDLTSGNFGITNWEGLSGVGLNIQTQQVPFQDGGVFLDALMEQREISVTVAIQDNNDLSARYELKRQLISALNPKLGEGVLVYTNDYLSRQIKAVPQLPIFENKNSNDAGTLKASVVFSCPSPYWEDLEETVVVINGLANIENTGDVPCSVKIDIPEGTYEPIIYNRKNNKKIELEGLLETNVLINTNNGQKTVVGETKEIEWQCGGIFSQFASGKGKNIYIGTIFVVEDIISGQTTVIKNQTFTKYCIAYAEGLFIIGGSKTIYTSQDGLEWQEIILGETSENIISIVYGNDMYIASSSIGNIYKSSDGQTWELATTISKGINSIIYTTLFVGVANNGKIFTSTDGTTWTEQTSGVSNNLLSITYNEYDNYYLAVGANIGIKSTDGITWETVSGMTYNYLSIAWKEGVFIAILSAGVMRSTNGTIWDLMTMPDINSFRDYKFIGIAFGQFVLAGNGGTIFKSDNGQTWTSSLPITTKNYLSGIAYGNGKFVVVGGGGAVLYSTDGKEWTEIYLNYTNKDFVTVAYGNGKFVAVGNNTLAWSEDGITWSNTYSGLTVTGSPKICFGNNIFVVGSSVGVYTSTDGTSWTQTDTKNISYVFFAKDYFFIGQYTGASQPIKIYRTSDGTSLVEVLSVNTSLGTSYYAGMTYGNGKYVLSLQKGLIRGQWVSSDGQNWVRYQSSNAYAMTFLNGIFYEIEVVNSIMRQIKTSRDGINWTEGPKPIGSDYLYNIFANEKNIVIVGTSGLIVNLGGVLQSNEITKLSKDSDMTFNLDVGQNPIMVSEDTSIVLSYRQKYIGV